MKPGWRAMGRKPIHKCSNAMDRSSLIPRFEPVQLIDRTSACECPRTVRELYVEMFGSTPKAKTSPGSGQSPIGL